MPTAVSTMLEAAHGLEPFLLFLDTDVSVAYVAREGPLTMVANPTAVKEALEL